jgi:hypothetical protein
MGWVGEIGWCWGMGAGYLQQSFLRMKMALNKRRKKLPIEVVLADMGDNIISNGADRRQFLCVFFVDLDAEFFFQGNKCFEDVQGIKTQVIGKRGRWDEGRFFNSQFFMKNGSQLCHDLGLINNSIHNQSFGKTTLLIITGKCNRRGQQRYNFVFNTLLQWMDGFVVILLSGAGCLQFINKYFS